MTRKITAVLIVTAILISLVSCDIVSAMESMGTNIVGVDKAQVENAVNSMTVTEDNKTTVDKEEQKTVGDTAVNNASTFTYTNKDGEKAELYTVGTKKAEDGSEQKVIGIGDAIVEVPADSKVDLSAVKSVLPPQDISAVSEKLSGSNKEEMLKQLDTPVKDETTKEAAEGTKAVVQVLLETADTMFPEDDSSKPKELVEKILTNMNSEEAEMTMGDVVVLQALTNLISATPDMIGGITDIAKKKTETEDGSSTSPEAGAGDTSESSSDSSSDTVIKLLEEANDTIMATAEILNTVSSSTTIFEGVDLTSLMGLFLTSSNSGNAEGE